MQTLRLLTLLVLSVIIAACSKDDIKTVVPEPVTYPSTNTWFARYSTFTATTSKWYRNYDSLDVIMFGDDAAWSNTINIEFYKKPTRTGTYKVVYSPDADDEVAIDEWQIHSGHSGSQDELGGTLYVTAENGKLTFKAADLELQHYTWVSDYNIDCELNVTEF